MSHIAVGTSELPSRLTRQRYYSQVLYKLMQPHEWDVIYLVTKNDPAFMKFIKEEYSDCLYGAHQIITLQEDASYIRLQPDSHCLDQWEMSEITSSQIDREDIDYFTPEQTLVVPHCHFNFYWQSDLPVKKLNMKFLLEGVNGPNNFFRVMLPQRVSPGIDVPEDRPPIQDVVPSNSDMQLFLDECRRRGEIKVRPVKTILTGFPRVGKTSFLFRLQGKKPPNYIPSTGIEVPVTISILERTKFPTAEICKGKWVHCDTIIDQGHHLLQHAKYSIPPSSGETITSGASLNDDNVRPAGDLMDKLSEAIATNKSEGSEQFAPTREFMSEVLKSSGLQNLEDLEESTTVYFMDTGGQPEFHELLPPILHGPALHLIFFNAYLDLTKPVEVRYSHKTEKESVTYTTNHSSIQILHQLLSTIYSLHSEEQPMRAKSFLLGSHIDLCKLEHLKKINKQIKEKVEATPLCEKGFLTYPNENNDNLIFLPVNNTNQSKEDIERIEKCLEIVFQTFEQIRLPLTWAAFHLILRYKYREAGVCTIKECTDLAMECGIEEENVLSVLRHLHNNLGTVLYYENVDSLREYVICDPNVLFRGISHLVAASFGSGFLHTEANTIRKTGKIPQHSLRDDPNSPFRVSHLINLLTHYKLMKKIEPDYFMPCLLQSDENLMSSISTDEILKLDPPPLLITFESGFVPVGIFAALVIELSSAPKWEFDCDTLYCNHVDFVVTSHRVELRSCLTYLEIRITADEEASSYCFETRTFINKCLTKVLEAHQRTAHTVMEGFYCPGSFSCSPVHNLIYNDGFLSCSAKNKCPQYKNPISFKKLFPDHASWFERKEKSIRKIQSKVEPDDKSRSPSESGIVKTERRQENTAQQPDISVQQSTSHTGGNEEPDSSGIRNYRNLLKKSPEMKDVLRLTKCISASWNELGIALDVSFNVREGLQTSNLDNDWKLETVLQKWIGKQIPEVTWETILKVLVECGKRDIAKEVQEFLEKPEVYNKYIKKEDFIPFTK